MNNLKFFKPYNLIAILCWPIMTFYYFLKISLNGKYQRSWLYRMGLKLPEQLPPNRRIWLHVLSVGEVFSVVPLVKSIKKKRPDLEIVVSTTTETGQSVARERLSPYVLHFFYLPHDFPWIVDAFIRRLSPEIFVLVETDIWPNLLRALERRKVMRFLVNARLSPKSAERFRSIQPFFSPFEYFDHIFAQSVQDKDSFLLLGAKPDRVHAIGNLKFDALPKLVTRSEANRLRNSAGIVGRRTWIAGSTHEGEEEILFRVHQRLRQKHPNLLLILAPRDVRRAKDIVATAEHFGLPPAVRSLGDSSRDKPIYLLDTLGELSRFYALGDVAFVGGSLVRFGGHNPLEAVVQGKPCVWGPHLFNFREIEALLLETDSGVRVSSEEQLEEALDRKLKEAEAGQDTLRFDRSFLLSSSGCAEKLASFLNEVARTGKV